MVFFQRIWKIWHYVLGIIVPNYLIHRIHLIEGTNLTDAGVEIICNGIKHMTNIRRLELATGKIIIYL